MSAWKEWQLAIQNEDNERATEAWNDYISECHRDEILDNINESEDG